MEFWPPSQPSTGNKSKRGQPTPVLGLGSNLVTLSQQNGRLEWSSAVDYSLPSAEREQLQLRVGKPILCLPPTRPPPLQIPATSVQQRAEQGANFLRTHLPEVDISSEVIRDQIASDEGASLRDKDFNPFQGNLLEQVSVGMSDDITYLAYPTGECNRELNLSPISYPATGSPVFHPSSKPNRIFSSPIQQISACADDTSSYLAIRTFGPTNFVQVKHLPGTRSPLELHLLDLGHVDRSFTGNNLIVDVKAFRPGEYVLASTDGSVYTYSFASGKANMNLIHTSHEMPDDFWRVAPMQHSEAVLLASRGCLECIDIRSKTPIMVYSSQGSKHTITSAIPLDPPHLLSLCTTERILWIDRRKPNLPLLAYKHGRQRDCTLRLDRSPLNSGHLFLSSRKNDLVTIYDVRTSDTHLLSISTPPYCLPAADGFNAVYTGRVFLSHSTDKLSTAMFSLSERGSIHALDLYEPELGSDERFPTNIEWSQEIETLHLRSSALAADSGLRGSQQVLKMDLTGVYDSALRQHFKAVSEKEEKDAESVYDLLEQLPTFWQSNSTPIEHMLTTYDIAFATGDEPETISRADFLTGSIVNSHRGYRALMQDRLLSKDLQRNAPWHYDLRNTLARLDPETPGDHSDLENFLHDYDLVKDDERSAASIKLENDAREQLVLDLALASDVYSAHPFTTIDKDDELNALTEALSLAEDIPPITFRYLRPVNRSRNQEEKDIGGVLTTSLGARLLLKEWEVGTNPNDYVYRDPYGDTGSQVQYRPLDGSQSERPTQRTQSQRPPMVVATASQPPAVIPEPKKLTMNSLGTALPLKAAKSQGDLVNTQILASQVPMASTQVLPGPFGGRPAGKKAVKKRVGGF